MENNFDILHKKNISAFGNRTEHFGMSTQTQGANPQMQAAIDAATISDAANKVGETATDSYIGQRVTSFSDIDPIKQFGVTIPTWIVLNQIMERYNNKCNGAYDTSIVSKYGKLGDKISKILFENPVGKVVKKGANSVKNLFTRVFYKNSALMQAFNTTPAVPELNLVKNQLGGMKDILPRDIITLTDDFLQPTTCVKDLDYLGATQSHIANAEKAYAKLSTPQGKKLFLETEEFKLLSKKATPQQINAFKNSTDAQRANILKELKITKGLKFNSVSEYELIKQAPEKHLQKILDALKKTDKNIFVRNKYSDKNGLTKLMGEVTGRKVPLSQLYNKLYATMGGNHKTVLGRGMAKLSNPILEGATNRIAGGKFAALLHAFFLAEVLIRANRQEGLDNKFKSFMERFAELIGFFIFMPPSLRLTYKSCGLKYAGMTPQQVEAYRAAVEEFNKHVVNHDWTKQVYKQKYKELMSKFRPKTKNPFVWLGRKIGDIMSVGLEQVRPYSRKAVQTVDLALPNLMQNPRQYLANIPKRLKDIAINPKYWFKQALGYPIRFAIPMIVLVPFFNKILVKGVNGIFGKPKEGALLDEGKEEKEQAKMSGEIQQTLTPQQMSMLNFAQNATANSKQSIGSFSNVNPVPTVSQGKEFDNFVKQNRYIPSSEPVKLQDNSKNDANVDAVLKQAEPAEKRAQEKLSRKY